MKFSVLTTFLRSIVFTFILLSLPNVAFHVSHPKFSKTSFESSIAFAATADTKALDSLYHAAKKGGRAVFWGPTDPEEIAPIFAAFKKRFPGIEMTHFEIQPNEFTQRFVAEGRQDERRKLTSWRWVRAKSPSCENAIYFSGTMTGRRYSDSLPQRSMETG